MTTPTPTPDTAAVDQALAERCTSSGEYLAGLLAHAMLEAAGCPEKLPELLLPEHDPEVVRAVWNAAWNAALPVGYRLGRLTAQPRWTPDALHRLRTALGDAGYQAMGRLAARSANTLPPATHPADTEQHTTRRDRT